MGELQIRGLSDGRQRRRFVRGRPRAVLPPSPSVPASCPSGPSHCFVGCHRRAAPSRPLVALVLALVLALILALAVVLVLVLIPSPPSLSPPRLLASSYSSPSPFPPGPHPLPAVVVASAPWVLSPSRVTQTRANGLAVPVLVLFLALVASQSTSLLVRLIHERRPTTRRATPSSRSTPRPQLFTLRERDPACLAFATRNAAGC